jgi:hypothetical protein
MDEKIKNIEDQLENIINLIIKQGEDIEKVNKKMDILMGTLDEDLIPECRKMGGHIDFIENVYETVKHPLGFLCNKIKILTGGDSGHTLTDVVE